jgi:DNA-binding MarR family transcriptional regulator
MLTTLPLAETLRVSIGRLARRLRQQSLGGLTPSQTSVLATLDKHGQMSMSRLADHEGISKPSVTGIVGRLVDKGLVERQRDPGDGRSAIVIISEAGRQVLEERRRERTAYLARRIAALDDEDREILERAAQLLEGMVEEG